MRTIHKYPVPMQDEFTLSMPRRSRVLCVRVQDSAPFVWALVDTERPYQERRFALCGTGHPAPESTGSHPPWRYVGTFQLDNGFVGHLFTEEERGEDRREYGRISYR